MKWLDILLYGDIVLNIWRGETEWPDWTVEHYITAGTAGDVGGWQPCFLL